MKRTLGFTVAAVAIIVAMAVASETVAERIIASESWQNRKRERHERVGGIPNTVLMRQSSEKVEPPSIENAIAIALQAAREKAEPLLIDTAFHQGRRMVVPDDYKTIRAAIDAAQTGDVVLVRPGTYYELIEMKGGVKLVSDPAGDGDEPVGVEGAHIKLPKRSLRTIIDGSRSETSHHGVVDFMPGGGRNTIIDGFTIQNLPKQDHHLPGHAHAVNVRGASPVIINCYVRNNGSTGIGNHVIFADQETKMPGKDFRWANVKHTTEALIFNNVVRDNFGLGIGCNHFSSPLILGNEVIHNSDIELTGEPSPGMGIKHGAAPTVIGNIVHDNLGGGILSQVGEPQGAHNIDQPTRPTVIKNVVYENGKGHPALSSQGGGSEAMPARFVGNFIYNAGLVGIGISQGAIAVVEENIVSGAGTTGISINGATVLKLNRNKVTGAQGPGILILNRSKVLEMVGNASDSNKGPRFMLRMSTVM